MPLSRTLPALRAHFDARRALRRARTQFQAAQEAALAPLIAALARTEFGHAHGLVPSLTYEEFRRTVAPTCATQLSPWFDRAAAGQPDQLWPGPSQEVIAWTSGPGPGERIQLTPALRAHLAAGLVQALHLAGGRAWGRNARGPTVFVASKPTPEGSLNALRQVAPGWLRPVQPGPDDQLGGSVNYGSGTAIGTWATLLGAPPCSPEARPRRVLVAGGAVGLFGRELKQRYGSSVDLCGLHAPAGTLLACQDNPEDEGMLVLSTSGVFVEFVPLTELHEDRLSACGTKALPLHEVRTGVDYVPLITSPGGLCRFVQEEVVRFVSTRPPRLVLRGSRGSALTLSGVQVAQADLWAALSLVCTRHEWDIVHVHVAPLTTESLIGHRRARHEWWIELRPETEETPTGPLLSAELDRELVNSNSSYRSARQAGLLDAPVVRLVMPGVFAACCDQSPELRNTPRLVSSRNDRAVAEGLTRIARFAKDQ